jgi:hypothetical protein
MRRKSGVTSWPPYWWSPDLTRSIPIGEWGIVDEVRKHNAIDNKIFVTIKHEGARFVGVLQFDDITFCNQLFALLRSQVGRPTEEVGNLDISVFL